MANKMQTSPVQSTISKKFGEREISFVKEKWQFTDFARFKSLFTDVFTANTSNCKAGVINLCNKDALGEIIEPDLLGTSVNAGLCKKNHFEDAVFCNVPTQNLELTDNNSMCLFPIFDQKNSKYSQKIFINVKENIAARLVILDFDLSMLKNKGVLISPSYLQNINISLENNASLSLITLNLFSDQKAARYQKYNISAGEGASITHENISLGRGSLKCDARIELAEKNASYTGEGFYLTDDNDFIEQNFEITHKKEETSSKLDFLGGIDGENSCSVWTANAFVPKGSTDSSTDISNKNIALSDASRIISIPKLEIIPNKVKHARHASLIGKIDKDELFYLRSRGISFAEYKKTITQSYLEKILSHIENEELISFIKSNLEYIL